MSWSEFLNAGRRIAETVAAANGVDRDIALVKKAGINLLLAGEFPIEAGLRAWKGKTLAERLNLALDDYEIRAWLTSWADAPRALKRGRRAS